MHRRQAGRLDETGWTEAVSTRGGFSVRLPLTFNDYTSISPPAEGPVSKAFTVGNKTVGGTKFLAVRLVYREPAQARVFFTRIRDG